MRATIKMIAERAGVSIGTVDRVLHERPYVKEEVRQRVLEAIEALEYRPNRMASALATSGTPRRFALVEPEWDGYVLRDMEEGIARFQEEKSDYNITLLRRRYPQQDTAACLRILAQLQQEDIEGIALCASDCAPIRIKLQELAEQKIPVVTFNSDIDTPHRLCYVGENARQAGRIAGEIAAKFFRPGDRILVCYAGLEYAGHKARTDGFLERLSEVGVPRHACRIAETYNAYGQTFREVSRALAEEPDLRYIYMANLSVSACVEAVRQAGREGQIHILTHDTNQEIREYLKTGRIDFTIGQDLSFQSWKALTVLFDLELNHKQPEHSTFSPPSPIVSAENC